MILSYPLIYPQVSLLDQMLVYQIDFSLGGDRLKGFRNQGIGPIDNSYIMYHLGGKYFTSLSLEASFPIGIPEEYGVFGGLFLDSGSLWGLDNTDSGRIDDSSEIRSAIGVSIFWDTVLVHYALIGRNQLKKKNMMYQKISASRLIPGFKYESIKYLNMFSLAYYLFVLLTLVMLKLILYTKNFQQ